LIDQAPGINDRALARNGIVDIAKAVASSNDNIRCRTPEVYDAATLHCEVEVLNGERAAADADGAGIVQSAAYSQLGATMDFDSAAIGGRRSSFGRGEIGQDVQCRT
jgi:hypothetical protein